MYVFDILHFAYEFIYFILYLPYNYNHMYTSTVYTSTYTSKKQILA